MLRVQRLDFSYGKRTVLADISFEAKPGEIIAILGSNGSGKSTLLRCLTGILHPNNGSVLLDNHPYQNIFGRTTCKIDCVCSAKSGIGTAFGF